MKLETFVTSFATDGSKEKYVKSHMKNEYVPYVTKCGDCERIVRSCHYKDVDGKMRFSMNSSAQAMMFALLLVDRYTKIDVEYGPEVYDELQKCGALGMIISAIPEAEYQEYSTLMHMAVDDIVMSETDVAAKLSDLLQAMGAVLVASVDGLNQLEEENGTDMGSDRGDSQGPLQDQGDI